MRAVEAVEDYSNSICFYTRKNEVNTIQRIAKNLAVMFVSDMASKVLGFLCLMYTARYFDAEGFGVLSFAWALTGIFGVICDLGLHNVTVREVAREKSLAGKYIGNIIVMKLLLSGINLFLIALTINIANCSEETIKVVYLVALSVVVEAFNNIFYSVFKAFEKMEYVSIGGMLGSVLKLSGILVVMISRLDIVYFAFSYFMASLVVLGYNWFITKRLFIKPDIRIEREFWKSIIKESLPFGVSIIFVSIFCQVDSVMLSFMKGNTVVGWYNAAYRLIFVLLFIPGTFNTIIYPVLSRLFVTSQGHFRLTFETVIKHLTILGIFIGVGTTILAKRLILMIFGEGYINSVLPLQILVWSMVFIFISQPIANLFNASNRQIITTKISGFCVVLNIALNFMLIPKYSLIGAGIATLLTEFLSLLLHCIQASKVGQNVFTRGYIFLVIKVLISGVIMGAFIIYFHKWDLPLLIVSGALLSFTALWLLGGINKEDTQIVKKIMKREKNEKKEVIISAEYI